MWMLVTARIGLAWYFIDETYIVHGATQADEVQESFTGPLKGLGVAGVALHQINVLLAEGVMVRLCTYDADC